MAGQHRDSEVRIGEVRLGKMVASVGGTQGSTNTLVVVMHTYARLEVEMIYHMAQV